MNIALIFAGGTGQRMNSRSKPKQFLELYGKPIIIHTLEYFEENNEIDAICIVCLSGWQIELKHILAEYDIQKVKWVVTGGNTGHDSIYNGLIAMQEKCSPNDIVLIHDGVRPLITDELITDCIAAVKQHGNAITVEKAAESVVEIDNDGKIINVPNRSNMRVAKAPQGFYFKDIFEAHQKAEKDGFKSIDSAHLMNYYCNELYTIDSTPYNIKIATPSDYYVFRALFEARENQQIFGL